MGKDEYKIMVRLAPEVRENLNGLNEIVISKDGKEAPLTSVATITQGANIASIKHVDGKRTIQVTAELAPGQKDERGPKKLAMAAVKKMRPPPGYTIRPGSGNRMQAESQGFLVKAFFIAMGLVFLTMVFQFNSLFQPFLILIGILLSLGGVFWGLLITNKFSAFVNLLTGGRADLRDVTFAILMSGVGIIALAGVVAKNGIVLIDFMNRLRKERPSAARGGYRRRGNAFAPRASDRHHRHDRAAAHCNRRGPRFPSLGSRDAVRNNPVVGANGLGDLLGTAVQYPACSYRDPDVLLCMGKLACKGKGEEEGMPFRKRVARFLPDGGRSFD